MQTIKTALEEALKKQKSARVESFRQQFAERNNHPADQEMQQLLSKIAEVKGQIEVVRADLSSKHEEQALSLESQIKMLKQHMAELEDEENTLKKIGKKQRKALGSLQNDKDKVNPQVEQLQKESAALSSKLKDLKLKLTQRQSEWKSAHEQMIAMELKCRSAKLSLNVEAPEISENDKELQDWNKKVGIMEKAISTEEAKQTKRIEELKQKTAEAQAELSSLKKQEQDKDLEIQQLESSLSDLKAKNARAQQRNSELLKQMTAIQPPPPPQQPSPGKRKLGPVLVRGRRQNATEANIRSQSVPVDTPEPIRSHAK